MNVKEYRESRGYTQQEVASKLGIDRTSYSSKEAGRRKFNIDELLMLEIILDVSIGELFKEKKKEMEKMIKGDK